MKILIYFLRTDSIHRRCVSQLFRLCVPDRLQRAEGPKQCFAPCRTDPFDLIQKGMGLCLASAGTVVLNGKTVCFILYACDQFETF